MNYLDTNRPFFEACHEHGLAMPINQWDDWSAFEAMWYMGGEL